MIRAYWIALVVLAIALVLPAGVLVYYVASTGRAEVALARSEERDRHERVADRIAARIRADMAAVLERERERLFVDYNYFTPPVQTNAYNPANFLAVSPLVNGTGQDPRIRSYFQVFPDESLNTPLVHGNPSPEREAVEKQNRVASRLRRVGRAVRMREEGRLQGGARRDRSSATAQKEAPAQQMARAEDPVALSAIPPLGTGQSKSGLFTEEQRDAYAARGVMRCVAVDKPILDATRNSAQVVTAMNKAIQGDAAAQQETSTWFKNAGGPEPRVPVLQFDFDIVTLDPEATDAAPIICALRRIEEEDPVAPRTYHQGFEIDHDYLVTSYFPDVIAGAMTPNFAARIALRTEARDAAIVRDLGRLLPTYELRAGPVDSDLAATVVDDRRRRDRWIFAGLGVVLAGALVVFWRLFRAEYEVGRRRQDFVSAVTHELKTPLTSIRMYAELLEDRWVDDVEKQRTYHGTIRSESERLGRLIGNVLDFSRLERGRRSLDVAPVDAAEVVREAVGGPSIAIEEAGGTLDLALPDAPPIVSIDRDALTQIVINLVDNAIKYGSTPPRVSIDLTVSEGDVVLGVENDGEPIARPDQQRIFDDFVRGRDARVEQVSGVGLGLALVRRLAAAHRGSAACREPRTRAVRFEVRLRAM